MPRHLARPSARGTAFCGFHSWARFMMMNEVKDVDCADCLRIVKEMHDEQART